MLVLLVLGGESGAHLDTAATLAQGKITPRGGDAVSRGVSGPSLCPGHEASSGGAVERGARGLSARPRPQPLASPYRGLVAAARRVASDLSARVGAGAQNPRVGSPD